MFLKYNLILFMFNFQRAKAETKFRQRLVTDGRVSAQDASAATWVIGRAAAEQRWQGKVYMLSTEQTSRAKVFRDQSAVYEH